MDSLLNVTVTDAQVIRVNVAMAAEARDQPPRKQSPARYASAAGTSQESMHCSQREPKSVSDTLRGLGHAIRFLTELYFF